MTDKVSPEKIDLLKAYGAEVIVCPVDVEPDDPRSYYSTAERLSKRPLILFGQINTPIKRIHMRTI